MARRVLVIAYDFPPHGAIGTMRTLRLVRQLDAQGWNVTVLTGAPSTYLPGTPMEPALESLVPARVHVLRVPALRPFNALKRHARGRRSGSASSANGGAPSTTEDRQTPSWASRLSGMTDLIEAALDIPDKESGWIAPAVARGVRHMVQSGRPDVLYSSAPPWSGQAVALMLATASRLPWVADFRDPWARAPWREWRQPFRQRAAALLERRVVRRADTVLFVTEANRSEFAAFYGASSADRLQVVPNGCDPTEIESIQPLAPRKEFVLLHAGTLYGARSPMPVIEALARLAARGGLDRNRFRLRLLGNVSLAVDLPAECRRLGIADLVELVPRVTRAESLQEMKSASALLLVQTGTTVSVPGKAYEYLAAGRPILALSEEGETAALVRASGVGVSVRPDAPSDTIEGALLDIVAMAGSPVPSVLPHLFDGRVHADQTVRMLESFAARGRQRRRPATVPRAAVSAVPSTEEPRQ